MQFIHENRYIKFAIYSRNPFQLFFFPKMSEKNLTTTKTEWLAKADANIAQDFMACLHLFQKALAAGDSYAQDLKTIGFDFKTGKSVSLLQCLEHVSKRTTAKGVCLFENTTTKKIVFFDLLESDGDLFQRADMSQKNLLTPQEFVNCLAQKMYPIGDNGRANTNQTLCFHDFAHLSGFAAMPEYFEKVVEMCQIVGHIGSSQDARLGKALQHFDSFISLRLYYIVEILTLVRDKPLLERVLKVPVKKFEIGTKRSIYKQVHEHLSGLPAIELTRLMQSVCANFHAIVVPLGGESRDIFNRKRKQSRKNGTPTSLYGPTVSKFAGNSIYSLYYDAKEALENTRPEHHKSYKQTMQSFARLVAALVGTAQLTLDDWIDAGCTIVPDKRNKVYQYVDGLFTNKKSLFWRAFCSKRFDSRA